MYCFVVVMVMCSEWYLVGWLIGDWFVLLLSVVGCSCKWCLEFCVEDGLYVGGVYYLVLFNYFVVYECLCYWLW